MNKIINTFLINVIIFNHDNEYHGGAVETRVDYNKMVGLQEVSEKSDTLDKKDNDKDVMNDY